MIGSAQVIRADARSLPLPDNSVDLVVTSPPYFALRSYQDCGEHYAGQIGDEATPAEFVDALLAVTRECVRVLKPSGSLWVNLGDKYSGGSSGESNLAKLGERLGTGGGHSDAKAKRKSSSVAGMRPKSLIGIPWRYALRCIDDLGLILRAEVIWSKPNGLPESVTDRVRRSHETWFHFTREPRYYSAVDEIREAHRSDTRKWQSGVNAAKEGKSRAAWHGGDESRFSGGQNPLGKLPGSVWTIPTEPLTVPDHLGIDHFAAFPTEWPRRIIQGWSPAGVCTECGEGRRPVTQHLGYSVEGGVNNGTDPATTTHGRGGATLGMVGRHTITGYACACKGPFLWCKCGWSFDQCADQAEAHGDDCCPDCWHDQSAPTTPGVVLDPFGGTGTTALVAKALGRHGISVDMSADYCRLAEWRTNDPDQLAKAARVDKPPKQIDGQLGFDLDMEATA